MSCRRKGANTVLLHSRFRHFRALVCVDIGSVDLLEPAAAAAAPAPTAAATVDPVGGTGAGTVPDGAGVNEGPVSSSLASKQSESNLN